MVYAYALISIKDGVSRFIQSSKDNIVFRVQSRDTHIPFRSREIVKLGSALGWTVSNHPGLHSVFHPVEGNAIFVGDENVAVRVNDNTMQLVSRANEGMMLVDPINPHSVILSTKIELNPTCIACPTRGWTAYFPVVPDSRKRDLNDFVAIINSGASAVFAIEPAKGSDVTFRTVKRKQHGFRTFAYSRKQRHRLNESLIV